MKKLIVSVISIVLLILLFISVYFLMNTNSNKKITKPNNENGKVVEKDDDKPLVEKINVTFGVYKNKSMFLKVFKDKYNNDIQNIVQEIYMKENLLSEVSEVYVSDFFYHVKDDVVKFYLVSNDKFNSIYSVQANLNNFIDYTYEWKSDNKDPDNESYLKIKDYIKYLKDKKTEEGLPDGIDPEE